MTCRTSRCDRLRWPDLPTTVVAAGSVQPLGVGGADRLSLALALLADALGDDHRAVRLHQDFKFKVLACWPETRGGTITPSRS
jgi:hypothetical protein